MGSKLKLIAGFLLFVIGVFIGYETITYALVDVLLVLAFILAMAGLIAMVSYFVDSSVDKTSGILQEVLNSTVNASNSIKRSNDSDNNNSQPLKVRKEFNDYYEPEEPSYNEVSEFNEDYIKEFNLDDFAQEETNEFDNQLKFTPNYDKPLKVTRKPRKRIDNDEDYEYEPDYNAPIYTEIEDKSDEIKKALLENETQDDYVRPTLKKASDNEYRDIKIDINDPESLPVPKLLRSFVVSDDGVISSDEAFEKLTERANKEMMLEIPNLRDLSDRFLSQIPTIYSRLIIEDFDVSDMSYVILIASLLKQGVHIKTIPRVNTINLITDDSQALIVSEGSVNLGDVEYGAIYNERDAISQIRSCFDRTWNVANDLDENVIMSSVEE